MTALPLIFDTTPGLGATKLRATSQKPFLHLRGRFETLAALVTFSPFWAGKSRRSAKTGCVIVHRCHGASPALKKRKSKRRPSGYEARGARHDLGRETKLWAGKAKFPPSRDVIGPTGKEIESRRTWAARDAPPAKKAASPSYGAGYALVWLPVAFAGPTPCSRAKIEHAIGHHCMRSLHKIQERSLRREKRLRSQHSRSQGGTEKSREGYAAVALPRGTARGPDASRTREVVLSGRRLHEASPTGPGPPGEEPLRNRRVVLPEATQNIGNDRFAPNFRHHPGIGGHQTPCYVPKTVFTPPG